MAQQVKTPVGGVTTTSSYTEGECISLVNLRNKNGALHPVPPRKVMQELSLKYDIVFLHQNNDYQNWIGVLNSGSYATIYWDILSEQPKQIGEYVSGNINNVQQIGNTLSLITSDNILYLLYQNSNYIFLGELPQVPAIQIGTSSLMSQAGLYFVNEYASGTITPDNFIDATKGLVNRAIDVLINGKINDEGKEEGGYGLHLFDAHYIRYAFRLFDGTLTKHSPPILVMPSRPIVGKESEMGDGILGDSIKTISYDFDSTLNDNSRVDVYGFLMYLAYDLTGLDNWQDVIQSVDIFISQPVGISNIENIRTDMPTTDSTRLLNFNLIKGISSETLKNTANVSTFYYIRSLRLGTMGSEEPLPSKDNSDDISRMENLIYQEVMSDDNFSNHKYGAEASYTYNNRLHIANTKTTFFKGFSMEYFNWLSNYNGIEVIPGSVSYMCTEIEIQTGTSLEKVYSFYAVYTYAPKLFSSAFLSYPDVRAKKITIYEVTGNVWVKVFTAQLKPHGLLNLAYHLNSGLKPIVGTMTTTVTPPNTSKVISLSEPNKIKVSDLNNPMRFPNINTYQAGNGTILAMATNAIRISEGQFGQYPLYIFTNQGIYSLDVGQGEVVYSSKSAPTSYEVPTTAIVASTPFGVIFTSHRGICIIKGQEVELITPQLHEAAKELLIEFLPSMEGIIHKFPNVTFSDYLQNIDNLVYNPYENELIICDKESDFNYVLNLYSHAFWQSTEIIDQIVKNTFPELYVIENQKLKNYQLINTDETGIHERANVSFILRPLQYGTPYIKWLEKMQLFCTLYDVNPLVYLTHSSMDGINFKAMSGMAPTKRGNYTTLETPRIARNKYRDFLFSFGASLSEKSIIYYLQSWVGSEYKDNLMK